MIPTNVKYGLNIKVNTKVIKTAMAMKGYPAGWIGTKIVCLMDLKIATISLSC